MKYLFIINPVSGYFKSKNFKDKFNKKVKSAFPKSDCICTELDKNAYQQAMSYGNKYDVLVAVGGDGTCHEVLNACIELNKIMGIIPVGTGNLISRILKIPRNIKRSLEVLKNHNIKKLPLGFIKPINRYFLLHTGFGVETDISIQEQITKKRRLHLPVYLDYLLKIIKAIRISRRYNIKINVDGNEIDIPNTINFSVCNLTFLGLDKWLKLPKRNIEKDLQILWAEKYNLYNHLLKLIKHKAFKAVEGEIIQIKTPGIIFQADGEIIGESPFTIIHSDKKLEIITA